MRVCSAAPITTLCGGSRASVVGAVLPWRLAKRSANYRRIHRQVCMLPIFRGSKRMFCQFQVFARTKPFVVSVEAVIPAAFRLETLHESRFLKKIRYQKTKSVSTTGFEIGCFLRKRYGVLIADSSIA